MKLPAPLTRASLEAKLGAALAKRSRRALPTPEGVVEASVLLPLFERDGDLHLWVVKRPEGMRKHGGQLAFPGGKRDADDQSPFETALREAEEEIGLPRQDVNIAGSLDDLVTGTGFVITPVVGFLPHDFVPRPNPAEVERVHAVSLRTFAQAASGTFPRIGYPVGEDFLWGATFAIGRHFVALVSDLGPDDRSL